MRLACLSLIVIFLAPSASARPPSLVPADAPELSAPGAQPVGVRELHFEAALGRTLGMTIWYPAAAAGTATHYVHDTASPPAGFPARLVFEAIASADAAPAPGPRLPLVVLSHGLGRWSTAMSGMAENLASKGYVVASIDHDDAGAMDPEKRLMVFASAYVRRSQDQRAAIAWLTAFARSKDPLARRIDAGAMGIVGYSMGGFGALATSGAGHDRNAPVMARVPAAAMTPVLEGAGFGGVPAGLKAAVLIAPWGGMADVRAFTPAALASIKLPSLWIMGDQDYVAGTAGIKWLYDHATRSDRRLLVFANARHNLGGNPPPASAPDTLRLRDAIDEPVWRKDMADAIIYRTLTAFFEMTLKGDASKAAWLDPAADGQLQGFPERWQLGLGASHTAAK